MVGAYGACLQILQHPEDAENRFYDLAWSPDGKRLASGGSGEEGGELFVWEIPGAESACLPLPVIRGLSMRWPGVRARSW